MKNSALSVQDPHQKQIVKLFDRINQSHSRWEIWADFITMIAIAISNCVDKVHAETREQNYRQIASKYLPADMRLFSEMFTEVVTGMDEDPNRDFLGELYMGLNLGNEHAGQFFTPYSVCLAMAEMTITDTAQRVSKNGWVSVSDPACGAGALLVAFANACRAPSVNVNYQTSVLFVAQDIDFIVGCMCYVQLSLLGCAGYVVIGDSLAHPSTSYDRRGLLPRDDGNVWYTPGYFRAEWHWRKALARVDVLMRNTQPGQHAAAPATEEPKAVEPQKQAPPMPEPPLAIEPAIEPVRYGATDAGQLTLF